MKLILRADVDTLGRLGDIVTVKPGFGRNFLVPQGLAMAASAANLKQFELERKKLAAQADGLRAAATALAEKIAAAKVTIAVRVGEGDRLYGSVTTHNIADALAEQGIEVDRRKIEMPDAIRALGEFEVEIRLHPDVQGVVKLQVVKHGQPEKAPEQQPEA
jgi:large subunit ribosomal protein L9